MGRKSSVKDTSFSMRIGLFALTLGVVVLCLAPGALGQTILGHGVYLIDDVADPNNPTIIPDNSTTGGLDLTINGTATTSTDTPFGQPGDLSLDSSQAYLTGMSGLVEDISFQAWVKTDTSQPEQILFKAFAGGYYQVRLLNGMVDAGYTGGFNAFVTSPANAVPTNTWTHVAATFEEKGPITIYVNGTSVGSVLDPNWAATGPPGNQLVLAEVTQTPHVRSYNGLIDEIKFSKNLAWDPNTVAFYAQNPLSTPQPKNFSFDNSQVGIYGNI